MKSIIFGTDWWTDCDDAVALRLICNYVKEGKVNLLGVGINACMEYSVASLKGFLNAEGLFGIPVGIDLEATDYGGNPPYQKRLAETYGKNVSNADAKNAVSLYREILAAADEKIEIIEVGFLQVISAVLKSGADGISEKTGYELVRDKVSKIWVMAGKWDSDGELEHNFCKTARSRTAGKEFCELCPVPVTFLGWEIGYGVISGGSLPEDDFLRYVLVDHGSENGRHSWDPMLTLMALIGDEREAGYGVVTGTASVDADTGANHFVENPDGLHKYVVMLKDGAYYENEINKRL